MKKCPEVAVLYHGIGELVLRGRVLPYRIRRLLYLVGVIEIARTLPAITRDRTACTVTCRYETGITNDFAPWSDIYVTKRMKARSVVA